MRHLFTRKPIFVMLMAYWCSCSDAFDSGMQFSGSQQANKNQETPPESSDQIQTATPGQNNEIQKFGYGDDVTEPPPKDYSIFSGSGSACAVTTTPGTVLDSVAIGDLYRTSIFHQAAVVDPGNTDHDPSVAGFGFSPVTPQASSSLNVTEFTLGKDSVGYLSFQDVDEIEYVVFAHQFAMGHDRIKIEVITNDSTYSDISTTNIYSAYGYLNFKNLRMDGQKIKADIEIYSFNYNPALSGAPHSTLRNSSQGASVRDATELVIPASKGVASKVSEKDVDITDAKIRITIDAVNYDSYQYRAIRGTIWSQRPVACGD